MHLSKICILCISNKPDSKEHIIPEIIGGRIKAKILCKNCNLWNTGYNTYCKFCNCKFTKKEIEI